jgi:hypothetical protein
MVCEGCGEVCAWNPWNRCSWGCYDQDRENPAEHAASIEAAPEAFAFFMGLAPGERVDGSDGEDAGWP